MSDILDKAVKASLGAASLTIEKVKEALDKLEKRGEITKEQSKSLLAELVSRGEKEGKELQTRISEAIKKALEKSPMATRKDLKKLEERVARLEKKIGK
jgi:polyhydroxyalkanoate synthesis regulator phasin